MLDEIIRERKRKLDRARAAGVDLYPIRAARNFSVSAVISSFASLSKSKKKISIVGRVTGLRDQGAILFCDLQDESGVIQVLLKKDTLANFPFLKETLDRGDFLSVSGFAFLTKSGQKSVQARAASIISKSLQPLPTQWYGIEETETRLRHRYLDILLHPQTRELFYKKALFWSQFRQLLIAKGFLEVETPVLERLPGGAEAEPFRTHHNALDVDFYLRISLELPLKKLLVAGYEKVFEIGRIFRNEGIDAEHLQDYTQLEFYWAYSDYRELMKFIEVSYRSVIKKVTGGLVTKRGGVSIKWGGKWRVVDYVKEFKARAGLDPLTATDAQLLEKARQLGAIIERGATGRGRLIDVIFKKTVRPTLVQPCFLINPPAVIEPLAKRDPDCPDTVQRFQVVAAGTELGKGFSELNDPTDQRARFEQQQQLREAGDAEAQYLDEDYLTAMEYGMPPASGFGVSERLFSVLMDLPIRETVIFPLLRPEK